MDFTWQDLVLAVSIFVFNLALLPSVLGKSKPALITCTVTALFMTATVVVYVSLSLWYTAFMSTVNTLLWATLALQQITPQRRNTKKR